MLRCHQSYMQYQTRHYMVMKRVTYKVEALGTVNSYLAVGSEPQLQSFLHSLKASTQFIQLLNNILL